MPVAGESHDTCWTVLRAAADGDLAARSVFARGYAAPIHAYLAHRWQDLALARDVDDAVQEVFVECIKPGGVLERADPERGEFRGLLYGVVRNVARRFEERAAQTRRRQPDESVYLDDLPHQAETLSRVFDRAWARSLLREAILRHAALARSGDGGQRRRFKILRLRHQRGLPVRKIAERLKESDVARIHNEYRRARREYAACLREVVASLAGARGATVDAECRRLTGLLGD